MTDLKRRDFLKYSVMLPIASAAESSLGWFCGPVSPIPDGLFHVFIIQTFADWDIYISGFSKCASTRESFGGQGAEVYRYPDDPKTALVHFTFGSEVEFNEYFTNPELPTWLEEVGAGHPVVLFKFAERLDVGA